MVSGEIAIAAVAQFFNARYVMHIFAHVWSTEFISILSSRVLDTITDNFSSNRMVGGAATVKMLA